MAKYSIDDPGFDDENQVLKNKLGIIDPEQIKIVETDGLIRAYKKALIEYSDDHVFSEEDICYLHKLFLGDIFEWAGKYRLVDIMSKDIRYYHARYIQTCMREYSEKRLLKLTPFTQDMSQKEIAEHLAEIHGELIIIHPFRDGNGRATRLFCDLLLAQANYMPIEKSVFYDDSFIKKYHLGIQAAWTAENYTMLAELFEPMLVRSE